MPAAPLTSPPRPALFGLYGAAAGLLVALSLGELTWWLARPSPPPASETPHTTEPASAPARLALRVTPKVSLYRGGRNTVRVRVARSGFGGPVTVALASAEPGLSAREATIPAGETAGTLELTATEGAKPGAHAVTITARASVGAQALAPTATVEVTVVAVPASLPRLGVSVSPKVPVYQRGKNALTVRVARGDFDGDVTVSFPELPEGVTAREVVVPAGRDEATAELTAAEGAKPGSYELAVVARAAPKGVPASAEARGTLDVLPAPRLPVDVAFALDCTGSMKDSLLLFGRAIGELAWEMRRARLDPRFGVVGFQDTTLGQPLKVARAGGQKLTDDFGALARVVRDLRAGGGGGEGDSSLDGVAEAADFPFREGAVRVVVLVTDGFPKRLDGRVKGIDDAVKHLRDRKVDQLHVVALPDHRKAFEPLWTAAKGGYFDLKLARAAGTFEPMATELAKAIAAASPEPPTGKPDDAGPAPQPVMPPVGSAKLATLPPGAEPEEPRPENLPASVPVAPPAEGAQSPSVPEDQAGARTWAWLAWGVVVSVFVALAIAAGRFAFLPGERPSARRGAVALAAGGVLGALALFAFDRLAGPLVARLAGGTLLGLGIGLGFGLALPLANHVGGADVLEPELAEESPGPRGDHASALPPPAPAAAVRPKIAPTKPAGGCPGCGRAIPGTPGERYCMLCDRTF